MKTLLIFLVLNLVNFSVNKLEDLELFTADTHHSKLTVTQKEYYKKVLTKVRNGVFSYLNGE